MSSTDGDNETNGEKKVEKVLRLRGLPWSVTETEIISWFGDDIKIQGGIAGVHLTLSREGRPSGEAYVELESAEDVVKGLSKNEQHMGHRYIEVFTATKNEMEWKLQKSGLDSDAAMADCCIRMRGIPYECSKEEILGFFSGLQIVPNGISLMTDFSGKSIGEAYVQFANKKTAEEALAKHKERMGHRYIEIFRSSAQEREQALGKMRPAMFRGARPGPYDRFDGPPGGGRFMGGRGMDGDWGGSGFRNPNSMRGVYSGGMGRGWSDPSVRVLLRGLPFRATEEDIAEFFCPLMPVDINLIYDDQGRSSGEAVVEFSSFKDGERAMAKNYAKMGYRYIELFLDSSPQRQGYDDSSGMGNRGGGGGDAYWCGDSWGGGW